MKQGSEITCPHCKKVQEAVLDDLVEVGDYSGSFDHTCDNCWEPFEIDFEYRPYHSVKEIKK